jgi:hypothetical protein
VSRSEAVAPGGVAAGGAEVEGALALLGELARGLDGLAEEGAAEGGDALAVGVVFAVPEELGHGWRAPSQVGRSKQRPYMGMLAATYMLTGGGGGWL